MQKLIERWRKDADQYMRQVDEARSAGTPCDQMLSMATALRQCAKELEGAIGEPAASALGKMAAGIPKDYSKAEIQRRTKLLVKARAAKKRKAAKTEAIAEK